MDCRGNMNVIERLNELIIERNLSVNKLAEISHVAQSTLSSALKNKSRTSITVDTLEKICYGLGITLSDFFKIDEQKETVSVREKMLLDGFRKLPEEKKKALIALLAD